MADSGAQAALLLSKQLRELMKNSIDGFSAGLVDDSDPFVWDIVIMGPPDSFYEGGMFKAKMNFPRDYPMQPPTMKFTTEIWHPNVFQNGDVCISILHPPGDDPHGYEMAGERWRPIHTVETIALSVISILSDPNDESPANVDAAVQWRQDRPGFKRRCARCVRRSQDEFFA